MVQAGKLEGSKHIQFQDALLSLLIIREDILILYYLHNFLI